MRVDELILLRRSETEELLSLTECIDAIEKVFRWQGQKKFSRPGILALKTPNGGLHVKTAALPGQKNYIAAKLNTNFADNRIRFGLPTIQGVILLCDADNGQPLAILDSIGITQQRTAAATAVAAKYLARNDSSIATICGCGVQGGAQLCALSIVLPLSKVYAFDVDESASSKFAERLSTELEVDIETTPALSSAIHNSDVCVTCTTAKKFFVRKEDIAPGTFIAAVGADDAHKQEIDASLMARAKVVADSVEQCCTIGDTHHAIANGLMRKEDVYAELCEIIAGEKIGRASDDEIIVFDSTGVAIEDAAAAVAIYEKARDAGIGTYFNFAA